MTKGLIVLTIQPRHLAVMDSQLAPLLAHTLKTASFHVPLAQQMRDLARSAYHQGLVDGAQVGQKMEALS